MENIRKQKREKGIFRRGELLGRFTVRKLYGWTNKRYDKKYWARLKRNWRHQKRGPIRGQGMIKTIKKEEEEIGQEESRLREQNKEDDEMGNIYDPYHEL